MKAILVLDLGNADSDYYFIDYIVRKKETGNALEVGYNVNLKPMPQYMTMKNTVSCDYNEAFVNGFNTCIDEILGEEE